MTAGVRDDNGRSPLDLALDEGSKDNGDVGLYLIEHHDCGDEQDKAKLLCKACIWGNLDVLKELVEQHNVDPNGEYNIVLHVICFDLYYVHEPLRNSSTLLTPITYVLCATVQCYYCSSKHSPLVYNRDRMISIVLLCLI